MRIGDIRVLLLGESPNSFHRLEKSLRRRRCRCRRVGSYPEAQRAIEEEAPDIVLSAIPPQPGAISSMAERLTGSKASFFYAYRVENGCWWLPALHRGERCLGAPAMRPEKFAGLIDQVVEEIRIERKRERKMGPAAAVAPVVPLRPERRRKPGPVVFTKAAG